MPKLIRRTKTMMTRKFPWPQRGQKRAVAHGSTAEIAAAQLYTFPVGPHSIHSGFVFFDVSGIDNPEAGAHVYLSGMKMDGKELFYFDIPLEKYLSCRPG